MNDKNYTVFGTKKIEACFDKETDIYQIQQIVRYLIRNSNDDIIIFDDVYRFLNKDNVI